MMRSGRSRDHLEVQTSKEGKQRNNDVVMGGKKSTDSDGCYCLRGESESIMINVGKQSWSDRTASVKILTQ